MLELFFSVSNPQWGQLLFVATVDLAYRGSPTYTKITNTVSATTVFGLCTSKWRNQRQYGTTVQSHQHEFHTTRFFLRHSIQCQSNLRWIVCKILLPYQNICMSFNFLIKVRKDLMWGILIHGNFESKLWILEPKICIYLYKGKSKFLIQNHYDQPVLVRTIILFYLVDICCIFCCNRC